MPMKDPHAYATRSDADLQQQNPKNPTVKGKSGNLKMKFGKLAKMRGGKKAAKKDASYE